MSCILALEENPEELYLETTSVLLKLVDNIIKNPSNPKYRSIRLGNPTVASKLLPAVGAMECLFEMGFEEVSTVGDKPIYLIMSHISFFDIPLYLCNLLTLLKPVTQYTISPVYFLRIVLKGDVA